MDCPTVLPSCSALFQVDRESDKEKIIILSPLLFQYKASCVASNRVIQISMDNIWLLKEDPTLLQSNLGVDNTEDIVDELKRSNFELDHIIIVDCTSRENDRNILGLQSIMQSNKLDSKVSIISSTSPFSSTELAIADQLNSDSNNNLRIDIMTKQMRAELLVGTAIYDSYIKSGVVFMQLSSPFLAASVLNCLEVDGLTACAYLHKDFFLESIHDGDCGSNHISNASAERALNGSRVPVMIIAAGPYSTTHEAICIILRDNGADTSRLILSQLILSRANIDYWCHILSTYACTLCVDCFGYSGTFLPRSGPMFPTDEEVLQCVGILCDKGFSNQLHLSINIKTKLQLSRFGGHGFGLLKRSVIPRLRSQKKLKLEISSESTEIDGCLSDEIIQKITHKNLQSLLPWYISPKPVELPVETLNCYICNTSFIPALETHYSKFNFLYCTSKCLSVHRNLKWKVNENKK